MYVLCTVSNNRVYEGFFIQVRYKVGKGNILCDIILLTFNTVIAQALPSLLVKHKHLVYINNSDDQNIFAKGCQ